MKRDYFVSVAIATYNGDKFIKEQLNSILCQLDEFDEVIISDDGSTDNTINIIKSFKDKRIKILNGEHKGVKKNFENAIKNCKGKYIFLSDQDDIWMPNKLDVCLSELENGNLMILHDCYITDEKLNVLHDSFFEYRHSKPGLLRNIIKNSYIGCCMAINCNVKKYILPIPNNVEMHDQWIGIQCEKYGNVKFIDDKLIMYRRHLNNVSSFNHYPIKKMLKNRINLIIELLKRSERG